MRRVSLYYTPLTIRDFDQLLADLKGAIAVRTSEFAVLQEEHGPALQGLRQKGRSGIGSIFLLWGGELGAHLRVRAVLQEEHGPAPCRGGYDRRVEARLSGFGGGQ